MAADTKGFDYTLGGEPLPVLGGKNSTTGFDYTFGGELFPALLAAGGTTYDEGGTISAMPAITGTATVDLAGSGAVAPAPAITGTATVDLVGSGTVSVQPVVSGDAEAPTVYDEGGTISLTVSLSGAETFVSGSPEVDLAVPFFGPWSPPRTTPRPLRPAVRTRPPATLDCMGRIDLVPRVSGMASLGLAGGGRLACRAGLRGDAQVDRLVDREEEEIEAILQELATR